MSKAWLPTDCSEAELTEMLDDDTWLLQEKADGFHYTVVKNDGKVSWFNRDGVPSQKDLDRQIVEVFKRLPDASAINGERLHRGPFVTFDLLMLEGTDYRDAEYQTRFELLQELHTIGLLTDPVVLVRTAATLEEKIALMEKLRIEQA